MSTSEMKPDASRANEASDHVNEYLHGYAVAIVAYQGELVGIEDVPEDFKVVKIIARDLDRESADDLAIAMTEQFRDTERYGLHGVALPPGADSAA